MSIIYRMCFCAKWLGIKTGGRPLGIWVAWLALAYTAAVTLRGLAALIGITTDAASRPVLADIVVAWPILILAIIALLRRRFIARTFVGMTLAVAMYRAVAEADWLGIVLALLGFIALLPNRRWFDESLPKIR